MNILIQKFGGSSLSSLLGLNSLLSHVKNSLNDNNKLVLVVSAIGRKGDPYATDSLIEELEKIGGPIEARKKDLIMSCGEIISASLVAHFLEVNKIPAVPLTGSQAGILTDGIFSSSDIIHIDTGNILRYLEEDKVVVVAGFQGASPKGEITTLGRGGSDISALALGGYLGADQVHIFTDVAGVAVADPKLVADSLYLDSISYQDMYRLASHGVRVIHPKAVALAEKYRLPIYIRSTFTEDRGSLIGEELEDRQRIIGIIKEALEDEDQVSIFFKGLSPLHLIPHLNEIVRKERLVFPRICQDSSSISFLTDKGQGEDLVRNLYKYFYKNKNEARI